MTLPPSQRRLQRAPDFTGAQLNRFSLVALRHGLPGALLGAACLLHPAMREFLFGALAPLASRPLGYAIAFVIILTALCGYAWFIDCENENRQFDAARLGWIFYLLGISIWEEWVFRLAFPYFLADEGVNFRAAVVGTNLAFGAIHYFTLRWKWQWCLGAFFGGVGLSRLLHAEMDLALVIGLHWVATFLNTPRLPGEGRGRKFQANQGQES